MELNIYKMHLLLYKPIAWHSEMVHPSQQQRKAEKKESRIIQIPKVEV